jgi:hypothetical protein
MRGLFVREKYESIFAQHLISQSLPAEITLAAATLLRTLVPIFAVGCGKTMYIAQKGLKVDATEETRGLGRVLRHRDLDLPPRSPVDAERDQNPRDFLEPL